MLRMVGPSALFNCRPKQWLRVHSDCSHLDTATWNSSLQTPGLSQVALPPTPPPPALPHLQLAQQPNHPRLLCCPLLCQRQRSGVAATTCQGTICTSTCTSSGPPCSQGCTGASRCSRVAGRCACSPQFEGAVLHLNKHQAGSRRWTGKWSWSFKNKAVATGSCVNPTIVNNQHNI
jgi:hypothetical protein